MKRAFVLTVALILTVCLILTGCKGFADNASSDIAVNTETDFEIAQSTEDVTSDTGNNQGDGQTVKDFAKDTGKQKKIDQNGDNNTEKTIKVNGKSVKLKYVSSKNAEPGQEHGRNIYSSQDGVITVEYDAETGLLLSCVAATQGSTGKSDITKETAISVAKNTLKDNYGDLDFELEKVMLSTLSHEKFAALKNGEITVKSTADNRGYDVKFCRCLAGYKTNEYFTVWVLFDGTVIEFNITPIFNGVDTSKVSVDVSKVNQKLDKMLNDGGQKYEYTVGEMRLSYIANLGIVMNVKVALKAENGAEMAQTCFVPID